MEKKQTLKKIIEMTGGFATMQFVSRMQPRILMYHRIIDHPHVAGITPEVFEQQMAYVADKYRVVPVDQAIQELMDGEIKPNTLAITFDDGHFDFYSNAWPILKKYQLPATLYVATDFVGQKQWLWPDLLKYILLENQNNTVTVNGVGEVDICNLGVASAWNQVADFLLEQPTDQRGKIIADIAKATNVDVSEAAAFPFASVNWEQVREMVAEGLDIGSHTVTHPVLSSLNTEQLNIELAQSAQKIKQMIGRPPTGICYPNGRMQDINSNVIDIAKKTNYKYGILALNYAVDDDILFKIGRIAASSSILNFKWRLTRNDKVDTVQSAI